MTKTQRFTLVATGLGLFMIFLDTQIVNVALPSIQANFKVGESGLQWVVTAYSLGMAVAIMSSATLADLHGRRKLYLAGIALFTASSVACGMAGSLNVLSVSRAIQGMAAATVNVTSLALVSSAFPDRKQKAWAIGIWTAIASTATALGPTLGGILVQDLGWRVIFLVNIPVGVVVIFLTWRFVAESRDERPRRFDIPGQLLFMSAVGAFAFAVIEGPHAGWLSAEILGLFAVSAAALTAFVYWERRSADPMMDLTLFRDRSYSLAILTIFAVLFALFGMLLLTTQYLQNVRGYSPTEAGFLLLPFSATAVIVSIRAGKLMGTVGSRRLILAGLAFLIGGLGVMIAGMGTSTLVLVAGLVLAALGCNLCLTPITALSMSAVPPERAGMASGIMSAQRALGSTVGFAVLGSILAAWLGVTLERHLTPVLTDAAETREVAASIIAAANPRAYAAEIAPGRPIQHIDPVTREAIVKVADHDFIEGIRLALATAVMFLVLVLAAGFAWFPRGKGGMADAAHEAAALKASEAGPA